VTPRPNLHAAADKYQTWRTAAATTLIARADANSLATASGAALCRLGRVTPRRAHLSLKPSALDLAARASELGFRRTRASAGCTCNCAGLHPPATSATSRPSMRWVDADNGAAWLQTLAAAQKDREPTEVDRILADMAHGAHFDFYWNRIVVLMVDALYAVRNELPSGFSRRRTRRG